MIWIYPFGIGQQGAVSITAEWMSKQSASRAARYTGVHDRSRSMARSRAS